MSAKARLAVARMALEGLVEMSRALGQEPLAKLAERALAQTEESAAEAARRAADSARKRIGIHVESVRNANGKEGGVGGGVSSDPRNEERDHTQREGIQGEGDPDGIRAESATRLMAPDRYRAAYEAGITAATGRPFAMPRKLEGELHQAIKVHSGGLRGDALLEWITMRSHKFASFVLKLPEQEQRFWSHYAPPGFLKWLNSPQSAPVSEPAKRVPRADGKRCELHGREACKCPDWRLSDGREGQAPLQQLVQGAIGRK